MRAKVEPVGQVIIDVLDAAPELGGVEPMQALVMGEGSVDRMAAIESMQPCHVARAGPLR